MSVINIEKEKDVVNRCLAGEKQAWDEFVEKYSKLIYNAIYRTLELKGYKIESDLVEDLYQEFFISILKDDYRKLRKFTWKNDCSIATWLCVIARNMIFDFIRKDIKARGRTESIDKEAGGEDTKTLLKELLVSSEKIAHEELSDAEEVALLEKAIAKLLTEDRVLLEMIYYQELSFEEIAKTLNKSIDALYMQKKRLIERGHISKTFRVKSNFFRETEYNN